MKRRATSSVESLLASQRKLARWVLESVRRHGEAHVDDVVRLAELTLMLEEKETRREAGPDRYMQTGARRRRP